MLGEPNLADCAGGGANRRKQVLWLGFAAGQRPGHSLRGRWSSVVVTEPTWVAVASCDVDS